MPAKSRFAQYLKAYADAAKAQKERRSAADQEVGEFNWKKGEAIDGAVRADGGDTAMPRIFEAFHKELGDDATVQHARLCLNAFRAFPTEEDRAGRCWTACAALVAPCRRLLQEEGEENPTPEAVGSCARTEFLQNPVLETVAELRAAAKARLGETHLLSGPGRPRERPWQYDARVATKAAVKKVFLAIRHKSLEEVRALLDADPSLANSTASAPPKKDDGQSPLQVALKTGAYEVADLLLDRGANVNFMETSSVNEWRTPALHDMLRGLVAWMGDHMPEYAHHRTDAWRVFLRMIELGADTRATDSYGNTCLDRALLDANSKAAEPEEWAGTLGRDFRRLMDILVAKGANPHAKDRYGRTLREWANPAVAPHLRG